MASATLQPSRASFSWGSTSVSRHVRDRRRTAATIRCATLSDLIGGDFLRPDLGRWLDDVEKHKALAVYSPHEGGYEGRYLTRLRYQGYHLMNLSARGLGDPESTLIKIHPVCPPHLGKQPIARWYSPPVVDYMLSLMAPEAKGLVLYIIEAKVLSKAELQFLALLPTLRPKVKVIAECGHWRNFVWRPLMEIASLSPGGEDEAKASFGVYTVFEPEVLPILYGLVYSSFEYHIKLLRQIRNLD